MRNVTCLYEKISAHSRRPARCADTVGVASAFWEMKATRRTTGAGESSYGMARPVLTRPLLHGTHTHASASQVLPTKRIGFAKNSRRQS